MRDIIKGLFGSLLQGLGLLISAPGILFFAAGMWLTDIGEELRIN